MLVHALVHLRDFLRTPITSPEGLANGRPSLDCDPSVEILDDVLDESCGVDIEDELVPEFDDNPGKTRGTIFSVLHTNFFPCWTRCGF